MKKWYFRVNLRSCYGYGDGSSGLGNGNGQSFVVETSHMVGGCGSSGSDSGGGDSPEQPQSTRFSLLMLEEET